ncbi:uncharacterized protein L969DRAFT_85176 [Mixia osmundae IAM 14324]|uniref:Uncharacterized protein n=1 Tax=Mixia osmundae (strain CBS 9802 / IAM 14324 / JCM 22182 / KY 12970) TaxID=764103 RepID=G7DY43_MIXOS|nr:uncharacterized protein L969DRAFT_85176 [Mixia osmundae IAM 14324]KEI41405.1 hypothetical protein L969DRAFT_85176 [Mixia osmundae IAM 14324]GAA95503.1 hypothetical protein E5Q_02158 [Mixia osmundae IAM 14324]
MQSNGSPATSERKPLLARQANAPRSNFGSAAIRFPQAAQRDAVPTGAPAATAGTDPIGPRESGSPRRSQLQVRPKMTRPNSRVYTPLPMPPPHPPTPWEDEQATASQWVTYLVPTWLLPASMRPSARVDLEASRAQDYISQRSAPGDGHAIAEQHERLPGLPKVTRECLAAEIKCYGRYIVPVLLIFGVLAIGLLLMMTNFIERKRHEQP